MPPVMLWAHAVGIRRAASCSGPRRPSLWDQLRPSQELVDRSLRLPAFGGVGQHVVIVVQHESGVHHAAKRVLGRMHDAVAQSLALVDRDVGAPDIAGPQSDK